MILSRIELTPLGNTSRTIANTRTLSMVASILSRDAALSAGHDLVFDPVVGDLVTHNPYDAYLQLVYNILSTELGSNPYWPEMGWPISRYVGAPLRTMTLPLIAADIYDALLRHPYTLSVDSCRASVLDEGGAPSVVVVEANVHPLQLPPLALVGVYTP